jgi:hypothetical protein
MTAANVVTALGPKLRRLAALRDRQRELKAEADELRDYIARLWPCPGESIVIGDELSAKLTVQNRTRFHIDKARKLLSAAQLR